MMGKIAQAMFQKAVRIAGDAAVPVSVTVLGNVVYDPETGSITSAQTVANLGRALRGRVTEAESLKQNLTTATHKVTFSMLDYKAAGMPTLPDTSGFIEIAGERWLVDKLVFGSLGQSITIYVSHA